MWKKLTWLLLVLALTSVFAAPSVEAGSRKRVLKALAFGGLFALLPPPPVFISPVPQRHYPPPRHEYVPGHWEMTHEWVPGSWERVWIPGHYDRWGNWVAEHYEDRQTPGYYEERRVWVEGYYRPY